MSAMSIGRGKGSPIGLLSHRRVKPLFPWYSVPLVSPTVPQPIDAYSLCKASAKLPGSRHFSAAVITPMFLTA